MSVLTVIADHGLLRSMTDTVCACGGGSIWTSSAMRAACVVRPADSPFLRAVPLRLRAPADTARLRELPQDGPPCRLPHALLPARPYAAPASGAGSSVRPHRGGSARFRPAVPPPTPHWSLRCPSTNEGRTWIRLDGPGGSEAWLIGWPPGTGTGWHDHGGSHGAFATAAGVLREDSLAARLPTEGWKTLELAEGVDRSRQLGAGSRPGLRAAPCARGAERVGRPSTRSRCTPTIRRCR